MLLLKITVIKKHQHYIIYTYNEVIQNLHFIKYCHYHGNINKLPLSYAKILAKYQ